MIPAAEISTGLFSGKAVQVTESQNPLLIYIHVLVLILLMMTTDHKNDREYILTVFVWGIFFFFFFLTCFPTPTLEERRRKVIPLLRKFSY